jgi:hypothetical protein
VKKSNIRRKTFVAREDLLDRIVGIAQTQGCSQFELINDILQLAIDSDKLNINLRRVFEERKILETAKVSGFILGLEHLWYNMADVAYKKDKRAALKNWFETGVWFATRYTTDGIQTQPFDKFKTDLTAFTWNAPEFKFELTGTKASVRIASPRFTEAYTFLFTSFLVGAMEAFGYKSVCQEVSRGMIRLDVERNGVNGSA